MGEHKGWRVRLDSSGKTRAEVWVADLKSYRSRSFDDPKEARQWAKVHAAGVLVGRPEPVLAQPAASTQAMAGEYLKSMKARGRSDSHMANVKRTLDALAKVAPRLDALTAGAAIEKWLDGAKLKPASRNRMLVEVRGLCRWAMRRDLIAKDPTRILDRATVGEYLRPQFTIDELVRLLSLPTPDQQWHRRFALMIYSGMRSDEAAPFCWENVDTSGKMCIVREHAGHRLKRSRERMMPWQPELAALLGPSGSGRISPLSDENDRRGLSAFLEAHGLPVDGRSPHSCRHTYAGMMAASGVSGGLLGDYLGHSSAATTRLYTKLASRYVSVAGNWPRGILRILSDK